MPIPVHVHYSGNTPANTRPFKGGRACPPREDATPAVWAQDTRKGTLATPSRPGSGRRPCHPPQLTVVIVRPCWHIAGRTWAAANSVESAVLAGERGVGLMTSRDRPLDHLREIVTAYRRTWKRAGWTGAPPVSGGFGLYVGADDRSAETAVAATIQLLWARAATRPAWRTAPAPSSTAEAARRVGFLYGSPETVAAAVAL